MRDDRHSARPGHSLLELLVALVLGTLIAALAAGVLHSQIRLARSASADVLRRETLRIAMHVLTAETRWLDPARDVRALAGDSLALRALRASGSVCLVNADGSALLELDALRAPDAAKDSALILRDSTAELVTRLLSAQPVAPACSANRQHYAVRTSLPLQTGDVILLFEPGNYYLSERALRYRLGREGRQPLTSEAFDQTRSLFAIAAQGGVAWLATLNEQTRTAALRVTFPLLNGVP